MEISADLREAVAHQRHVRDDALYKSTVLHSSGVAEPVDLSGLDFAQSNWTPAVATSASTMCGNVHKTDVNGSVRVRTRLVSRIGSEVRVRVRTRLVSRTGSGVRVNVSFRIFHNTEQHQAPPSKTENSIQTVHFSVRKDRK